MLDDGRRELLLRPLGPGRARKRLQCDADGHPDGVVRGRGDLSGDGRSDECALHGLVWRRTGVPRGEDVPAGHDVVARDARGLPVSGGQAGVAGRWSSREFTAGRQPDVAMADRLGGRRTSEANQRVPTPKRARRSMLAASRRPFSSAIDEGSASARRGAFETTAARRSHVQCGMTAGSKVSSSEALRHEISGMTDREVIEGTEYFVSEPLVERPCLETERIEEHGTATTSASFVFGCLEEARSFASATHLRRYDDDRHVQPTPVGSGRQPADDFARLVTKEDR